MRKIVLGVSLMLATILAFAQGATTSGMNGKVVDPSGEPIVGATVIAVNSVTGAQYGNVTDVSGYFRIPNMKVGGPYEVTISFVGFTDFKQADVYLDLGKTFNLNVSLQEGVEELSELVITAGGIIDANRTGAVTNVNSKQISSLPNASREINDFVRLTPQATFTSGGGISIAGTNNRYNSIFIDGATSNDVFGLANNGQNGGQVNGLSLISIDALEQLSVQVAPYDVTLGGFAGGGISAVTRSGTNEFSGSVYYFVRNDRLSGKTPGFIEDATLKNNPFFEREKLTNFTAKTMGVRLGGPIIKNKLFFFANVETQKDESPAPFSFDSYNGAATQTDINNLLTTLDGLDYDPGSYQNTVSTLEAFKFLVKVDWNINNTHKLTVRHSFNKGESQSPATSNTNRIRFANGGIAFPSTTNSTAVEVNSNFKNASNKLIVGYTHVVDNRDPMGNPFPYVIISGAGGDVQFGSEAFSTGNFLEQKILTLTDNYTMFKGKHTLTFGTHNEYYDMNNLFLRENFGAYQYDNISDFIADVNNVSNLGTRYDRSYSLVDDVTGDASKSGALFKAMQLGFYAQDEIQFTNKFKINVGLRVDIPMFLEEPKDDEFFNETGAALIEAAGYDLKGAVAGKAPDAQLMWAPRMGFNYDLNGDQKTQIRGGVGIFTSRVPLAWPGGMYNNNGATVGGFTLQSANGDVIDFNADPFNQPTKGDFPPPGGGEDGIPQGQMDLFVKDFKFPQVFRANLGIDQQLSFWGLIATAEVMYTSTINNIFYENVNLRPSTTNFTGADNRPRFQNGNVLSQYTQIFLGSNTNEGYTVNYTIGLTKPEENGFSGSIFYNYGSSFAIFEGTSSQNSSQWRGVYSVNGRNNAPLGRSDFDAGSRFIGTASYRKEYGNFGTTVSMVYNGQTGQAFSYTYSSGRFTGEDSRERALIYVPQNQSEIVFVPGTYTADEQWAAFNDYIARDEYLKDRRGKYAEKNEVRTPFTSVMDFRLLQDIFVDTGGKRNTIQLSLDIFNIGNMLNKDWGRRYFVPNGDGTSVQLLNYVNTTAGGQPRYTFNPNIKDKTDLLGKDDTGLISSRWQMQVGIRYIFN